MWADRKKLERDKKYQACLVNTKKLEQEFFPEWFHKDAYGVLSDTYVWEEEPVKVTKIVSSPGMVQIQTPPYSHLYGEKFSSKSWERRAVIEKHLRDQQKMRQERQRQVLQDYKELKHREEESYCAICNKKGRAHAHHISAPEDTDKRHTAMVMRGH